MAKKKKSKRAAAETPSDHSPIIEQCVIYAQHLAAYDAGFSVDHTGDAEYCGKGGHIKKARRAMCKLIGLSPHLSPHKRPGTVLTPLELHAKASVLAAMYGMRKHEHPDEIETAYIRFFAGEVSDFLTANHEVSG
jgi:hypothetical protein